MPVFWKAMVKDKKIKMNMKIHRFNLRSPANHSSIVQILLWPLKSSAISCASALTVSWHSGSGSDFEFINSKSLIYYNELTEYEAKPFSEPEITCSFSFRCLAILWLCVNVSHADHWRRGNPVHDQLSTCSYGEHSAEAHQHPGLLDCAP